MSLELLGVVGWEVAQSPMVVRDGALAPLPAPPSGQVYVRCEAGSGAREGYLLVPESVASSNTMITATDPVSKETVWQLVPQGMSVTRGKHLGQPYYPVHEKTVRTLDIAALKAATQMPPSVIISPAPSPISTSAAPYARAAAAGMATKSCGADGDAQSWLVFILCLALLIAAWWIVSRLLREQGAAQRGAGGWA